VGPAHALISEHDPDVVVTDIRMPPTNTDEGISVAADLRTREPDIGVVLLSQYAESQYALTLLADGTARRGYLLEERVADGDELAEAIRRVAEGGYVIDPTVIEGLVAANRAKPSELDSLPPRELEVLGRARATPRSRRPWCCPSGRSRSTRTRSSPSSGCPRGGT
jgi:DNA-binding NarL/FixJ family response regulator